MLEISKQLIFEEYLLHYSGAVLDCNNTELKEMVRKVHLLMNMDEAINPNINPERFYIQGEVAGRGLICVEEVCVMGLGNYVKISRVFLLTAARGEDGGFDARNAMPVTVARKQHKV